MKNFNYIMFLWSIIIVSGAFAMEQGLSVKQGKWFAELNTKLVEYYTGNNIHYYTEYRPCERDDNTVLFPIKFTDPLPIEYYGEKRFFVTSATIGTAGSPGEAYSIIDPAIKQLAVVRGVAQSNNNTVNVYMGLDTDNVRFCGYKGRDRIYPAYVMVLQTKQRNGSHSGDSWYRIYSIANKVKYFGNSEIGLEVRKHLPLGDCCWKNPLFQEMVKRLLGKRAQDFKFESQSFYFPENYWTDKENKLKGITYYSHKS